MKQFLNAMLSLGLISFGSSYPMQIEEDLNNALDTLKTNQKNIVTNPDQLNELYGAVQRFEHYAPTLFVQNEWKILRASLLAIQDDNKKTSEALFENKYKQTDTDRLNSIEKLIIWKACAKSAHEALYALDQVIKQAKNTNVPAHVFDDATSAYSSSHSASLNSSIASLPNIQHVEISSQNSIPAEVKQNPVRNPFDDHRQELMQKMQCVVQELKSRTSSESIKPLLVQETEVAENNPADEEALWTADLSEWADLEGKS